MRGSTTHMIPREVVEQIAIETNADLDASGEWWGSPEIDDDDPENFAVRIQARTWTLIVAQSGVQFYTYYPLSQGFLDAVARVKTYTDRAAPTDVID